MRLRVNQVAFGLAAGVLGASAGRMGVWTQGCSLPKCPGCASRHTWSSDGGKEMPIATLLRLARAQRTAPSGLTVSGGEPSDQADAVAALAAGFRGAFPGAELVLYTGLPWRTVETRFAALVGQFDVVVAGAFARTRPATALAGSSNQQVRLLTPLARVLYADWPRWPLHAVQVAPDSGDRLVTVGIPHTPRMSRAARRVDAAQTTWDQYIEESQP